MDRFLETNDVLLLKVLRNISVFTASIQSNEKQADFNYSSLKCWIEHSMKIVAICLDFNSPNKDTILELVSILANLSDQDLPEHLTWCDILAQYPFLHFVESLLVPGSSENDLVLEAIIIAGEVCNSNEAATLIAASRIVETIEKYWDMQADDEIFFQILATNFHFLQFPSTREKLFNNPSKKVFYL